ncbi:MAG: methionine--tRNA ligase [Acidimicrobiales bacterium]
MTTTYLTVAIPYVNADPHLGYAYELVQADIFARSQRAAGHDVRFLGGTDDYSLKNVLAAEAAGVPTAEFVGAHAARFAALRDVLGLSFDDYIHTSTDPRHIPGVERLWLAADANGDLYRRRYEGLYCVGCEQFYAEAELVDGCCPEHGTPLELVAEENWFFRLSRYQDHLEQLIATDALRIRPEPFRREALAFIRSGLNDISVSRSVERARGWGVPVPGDPSQVVYVWFDALANYISALGFGDGASDGEGALYRTWWLEADERVHVVGKGILRFHAIYWPAFLASAGQPAPTRIQVHPYLTVDGRKLSKSDGSALSPTDAVTECGTDALRWFFARDVAETTDTDVTIDRVIARANDDLANGIGNVVNRIVSLIHRCCGGVVPGPHRETTATETTLAAETPPGNAVALEKTVAEAISEFRLRDGAQLMVTAVAELNRDIEDTQPWAIAKDPSRQDELELVLASQVAAARAIASAIEQIVPTLAAALHDQLGGGTDHLPPPSPVFARIDESG